MSSTYGVNKTSNAQYLAFSTFKPDMQWSSELFTITAEIHARSLVNFYRRYADRHMNLKFM